ncbi:hypothetical protein GCM10018783_19900 [Streptomyces griseosporeus]|nr:hypothetical protein GCM10018783_19900 [Streptomyces griseosporeus]
MFGEGDSVLHRALRQAIDQRLRKAAGTAVPPRRPAAVDERPEGGCVHSDSMAQGSDITCVRTKRANRRRKGTAGGRPNGLAFDRYRRHNEVDRTINRLNNSRAVATRRSSPPLAQAANYRNRSLKIRGRG